MHEQAPASLRRLYGRDCCGLCRGIALQAVRCAQGEAGSVDAAALKLGEVHGIAIDSIKGKDMKQNRP